MARHSSVQQQTSVARSSVARVGARVVSSVALGITLILIARGSTAAETSSFLTTYSIALIVGLLVGIGAPVRVLRAPAESLNMAATLYRVHSAAVVTASALVLAVAAALDVPSGAVAGIVFGAGDTLLNYAQAHLTAVGRNLLANVLIMVHRLVPLVVAAIAIGATGPINMAWMAVALAIPAGVALIAPWSRDESRGRAPVRSVVGAGSWSYLGYTGAGMLSQLQIPVLNISAAASTVAAFGLGNRLTGPITLLTTSLTSVLVPELARRVTDPAGLQRLYRTILLACAGYFVLVACLAWPTAWVITRAAGPQYRSATLLIAACIVAAGLSAVSQGVNTKLLALGLPGKAAVPIIVGSLVGLALLFALGHHNDLHLLGLAPLVAEAIVLCLMLNAASGKVSS